MADNKNEVSRALSIKVDVDISEALTGLKALQREAKKAAKELRELESSSQALRELEEAHAKSKYFLGFRTQPNTEGDVE